MMENTQALSIVRKTLGFLESEKNFMLRENSPQYYYFESLDCEILVIFEMSKVYVGIRPIGSAKSKLLSGGIHAGRIDIKIVSQCLNPELVFAEVQWNAEVNLEEELMTYAKLIKRYCGKMINGDFSEWITIQNCLKNRRENSGKR
jgi:hypothetical protein